MAGHRPALGPALSFLLSSHLPHPSLIPKLTEQPLADLQLPAWTSYARSKVLYARTSIESDRDQVKRLEIGYSDEVSVFLNGSILYRGRRAQAFRDPRFLGIVNPENDAVYLPLKKGRNELMLGLTELGGGWGYICRLRDAGH